MKKTVFIFINCMAAGGAERVAALLLHHLRHRYIVKLVVLEKKDEYELPAGLEVIHLRTAFSGNRFLVFFVLPFLALKYNKLCNRNRVFASISFLKRPNYISGLSRIFGNKAKIILSERSYFSALIEYLPAIERKMSRFLTSKLYPHSDLIITNSKLISRDLRENFGVNGSFKVVYNPVDISHIESSSKEATAIPLENSFYFVHAGRFSKEKNQEGLIEAFRLIDHLNIKLILLGQGELRNTLIEKVKELRLSNKILFPPFDTNPFKYLSKSDCFVFPSRYEGFPNAILEAMACGLPVISVDCLSGPREILSPQTNVYSRAKKIEKAQYGLLIPENDVSAMAKSMEMMYQNRELRQHYSHQSQTRIKDFALDKQINQFAALIG